MKKEAIILMICLFTIIFNINAFAAIRICSGADCYVYIDHWLSDEAWGDEVTDFSNADEVYCNVAVNEEGSFPAENLELRWIKPNGEEEYNLGPGAVMVFNYTGGHLSGLYEWMDIVNIYREPGQWRAEHWVEGTLEGVGEDWHKLFTEYFTLPARAFLTISPPALASMDIIDDIDAPAFYPTGITFDGNNLWCAAYGTPFEPARIFKLNLTGDIIDSFIIPIGTDTWGLTYDGTHLWISDPNADMIYKMDTSGTILDSFDSPGSTPTGLAFDGENLWCAVSSGWPSFGMIYKLDTSGAILDSFTAPGGAFYSTEGLAFDGKYLWSCVHSNLYGGKIYLFDTAGNIIASFETPGSDSFGLAFAGSGLWHTDRVSDTIYKLESHFITRMGEPKSRTFTITSGGTLDLVTGTALITGPEASDFALDNDSCSGHTLAPSETCNLDVIFSPSSQGGKIAYLEIPSNDPVSPKLAPLIANTVEAEICQCDFTPADGDVDGSDLAAYIADQAGISLNDFAAEFGRTDCPN